MSFSAGAIVGDLQLNTSGFTAGILNAQAISAAFPGIVRAFLVNPLLGVIEVAEQAASALGRITGGVAADFHNVGLAAQRAGVDVEWLSRLSGAAATAGVGLDQLVTGFKILEQRAELANEGDKSAIEGFARLGISAQEAAAMIAQPQELFTRVAESIDAMGSPSQRTAAALGVLGRQGFNLVPLLTQGVAATRAFGATLAGLGGTVNASEAAMGQSFSRLEVIVSAAWEGIKKTVAEPILQFVADHFDEIVGQVKAATDQIRGVLAGVGPTIAAAIPQIIQFGASFLTGVVEVFKTFGPVAGSTLSMLLSLAQTVGSVLAPAFAILTPILQLVSATLQIINDTVGAVLRGIASVITEVTDAVGLTKSTPGFGNSAGATAGSGGGAGGTVIQKVEVNVPAVDVKDASTQIADKVRSPLQQGMRQQIGAFNAKRMADLVEVSL